MLLRAIDKSLFFCYNGKWINIVKSTIFAGKGCVFYGYRLKSETKSKTKREKKKTEKKFGDFLQCFGACDCFYGGFEKL